MQAPENFKASKIFPQCPVNTQAGTYPVYDKSYWMKNEAAVRTPATESEGGTHARSFDPYVCVNVAFHEDVADETNRNDPSIMNSMKSATRRVTMKIAIYDEVEWCADFFVTGIWGTDKTPGTLWSASSSTPLEDVDAGKRMIQKNTSFKPNKFILAGAVFDILKRHSTVKDQLKYTSSANVTEEMLARMFEVEEIVVLDAVYDSAAYGATASQGFIGGDNALLLHTSKSPSLEDPSAGYNFTWNGFGGGGGYGVRKIRQENRLADRVEAMTYRDFKQVASDLGYMFIQPIV